MSRKFVKSNEKTPVPLRGSELNTDHKDDIVFREKAVFVRGEKRRSRWNHRDVNVRRLRVSAAENMAGIAGNKANYAKRSMAS